MPKYCYRSDELPSPVTPGRLHHYLATRVTGFDGVQTSAAADEVCILAGEDPTPHLAGYTDAPTPEEQAALDDEAALEAFLAKANPSGADAAAAMKALVQLRKRGRGG